MNKILYLAAALMIAGGIAGFYYFSAWPGVARAGLVLLSLLLAAALLWVTDLGLRFRHFVKEALIELRKVVWPERKETWQATGIVFVFVVVLAIFMWLVDKSLEVVLYGLLLGWR